jgi:hypothetical protein
MDPLELLSFGKKVLSNKVWNHETVVHLAIELGQHLSSFHNISGSDKTELVCQTVLKMLDDAEKAEKEHFEGSTETKKTTIPWNECRDAVKTLPLLLQVVVKASRGEFSFPVKNWKNELQQWLLRLRERILEEARRRLASFSCMQQNVTEVFDPLSEVRELVSKVKAMIEEVNALKGLSLPSAELQKELQKKEGPLLTTRQLPPTPVLNDVSLPGGLATQEVVADAQ